MANALVPSQLAALPTIAVQRHSTTAICNAGLARRTRSHLSVGGQLQCAALASSRSGQLSAAILPARKRLAPAKSMADNISIDILPENLIMGVEMGDAELLDSILSAGEHC